MMIEVVGGPLDGDYWQINERDLDLETTVTPFNYHGNNLPQYRLSLHPDRRVLIYLLVGYESNSQ